MLTALYAKASNETMNATPSSHDAKGVRRFLEFKIHKGQTNPYSEVVAITPELATVMLQRNPVEENRKLAPRTVSKYAKDMSAGLWNGLNGQTIVFSDSGYLNDGQHRLAAIIEADVTIATMVVFGASRESRLTLDQNKNRSSGDYLAMSGIKNSMQVASISRILMAYQAGNIPQSCFLTGKLFSPSLAPTKSEVHKFAVEHLDTIENAMIFIGYRWKELPCPISHLAAAKIILDMESDSKSAVDEYIIQVAYGESLTRRDPAYNVRARMAQERLARSIGPLCSLELIFRGWNQFRRGKTLSRIVLLNKLPNIEV